MPVRSLVVCFVCFKKNFFLIFIFERERARAGEEQSEKETQNLKQAPGSEPSAHLFIYFSSYLTCSVILASGVKPSDSSLTCNTQCSSQQVPSSMPITHFPHLPSSPPPSTLSLFSIFKSLLWFASLSVFILFFLPFPYGHLLSFSNSTYK